MDGDRPVVGGRDLLEFKLRNFIREVFEEGWEFGIDDLPSTECGYAESVEAHARHDKKLHELLVSHYDGETSDAGAQDETSEVRELGDGVRPESHLIPRDPIKKVTDEFAREMELRFAYEGKKVAIGHCDLTKNPDGSIHARIEYYPQDKKSDDEETDEYGWIREEDVPEGWKKSPHAVFSDFIRQYFGPQNPR